MPINNTIEMPTNWETKKKVKKGKHLNDPAKAHATDFKENPSAEKSPP